MNPLIKKLEAENARLKEILNESGELQQGKLLRHEPNATNISSRFVHVEKSILETKEAALKQRESDRVNQALLNTVPDLLFRTALYHNGQGNSGGNSCGSGRVGR